MGVSQEIGLGLRQIKFLHLWLQPNGIGERLGGTLELPLSRMDITLASLALPTALANPQSAIYYLIKNSPCKRSSSSLSAKLGLGKENRNIHK
jgi:hypothetical protein